MMKISRQFFVLMGIVGLAVLAILGCSNPNNIADLVEENTTENGVSVTYKPNGATAGAVPIDTKEYSIGEVVTVMGNSGKLVGTLVGGEHVGSGIKQRFIGWNTDSIAATVEYIAGDTFTITESTTLHAIYTKGTDVLRKVGPAGGWVFYDAGNTNSWGRYLEAWNEDESGLFQWKNTNAEKTEGTLTAIGTGYDNTYTAMTDIKHPITEIVRNAKYSGHSDWFLASKDELKEMFLNLHEGDGYTPVAEFGFGRYWSSSHAYSGSEESAWAYHTPGGIGLSFDDYERNGYARVVRAF